ncbi:hypothetical protein JCGZ_18754 [Jatropha curcas]|uniref:SAUR family protein n=1 Tax=Jatropha curcas TaxID=180498 RepID=A0A067K1H6_JATCU|nr:auxin-responsive protein SAUR68-like [Jatropha curcas]KDP29987.1 hypothetical protein JCGZ_18754 [Jatropha curcas]
MISSKRLLKLAQKWQKLAATRRKRIILLLNEEINSCSTSGMAEKGHFVAYSADGKRFLLPLEYLNIEIIRELFNMAEEEFGLPSKGAPTLPCDAEQMEYVIALIKQQVAGDIEKALLMSIASCCSSTFYLQHSEKSHHFPVCSF